MARKCIALLSGGLDSMLAIRIMQEHGVEVEALNFKTVFTCCQDQSALMARELGVQLTVLSQEDDYIDLIRNPRFGYGKGANPCVDCRIYMFEKARTYMEQQGADFMVSGEVVGQRPMSQKRRDLEVISHHSGNNDVLLRPLSAKVLPPTKPETEGWVDRDKLYGFFGRSRKGLIQLAKQLDIATIPTPSTGCSLTEPQFSKKVFDLIQIEVAPKRWDFEILKTGRHFRFDARTKVVVGRNAAENDHLEYAHRMPEATSTAIVRPENFTGPSAIVLGPLTDSVQRYAAGLVRRYSKLDDIDSPVAELITADGTQRIHAAAHEDAEIAETISAQ